MNTILRQVFFVRLEFAFMYRARYENCNYKDKHYAI